MEQGKSKDSKLSWFLSSLKQWLTTRHIADGGAFYHKVEAFPTCCLGKKWYKIKTKTSKSHKLGLCGWIFFIQRLSVRPPCRRVSFLCLRERGGFPLKSFWSNLAVSLHRRRRTALPASLSQRVAASCDVQSLSVLSEVWWPEVGLNLKITTLWIRSYET